MSREIIDREHVGRLMHESWSRTKRAQGFHGPNDKCPLNPTGKLIRHRTNPTPNNCVCTKQHLDLIPWDDLPEKQKDINRHAFDDVLPYFERLLADERKKFVFERVPTIEEAIKEICRTLRPLDDDVEIQSPYLRARLKQLIGKAVKEERERLLAPSPCGQQGHIANDWYSVCSAHGFYQDSCGNCKCGDCFRCKELQAEREKVREMCAEWMEHSVDKGCSGVLGECSCGLENFLQLDLTAPNEKEGK
jgi:hypothetical protein